MYGFRNFCVSLQRNEAKQTHTTDSLPDDECSSRAGCS